MSPFELPPRQGHSLIKRALLACALIVLLCAGAAAGSGLLLLDEVTSSVHEQLRLDGRKPIEVPELERGDIDGPRTIMVLGTDRRYQDKITHTPARSDTILLVRIDPDKESISIMSLPRDLKVDIPGVGINKINYAYEVGGARKTIQTVKQLLSTPEYGEFEINHVIEISFGKFKRAINYIGCVYLDIDNRYYSDGTGGYATIDIQPGYQKLCGQDALDYVRYRHTDNDLVRGGRQQDFLRQLKSQAGVRKYLNFANRVDAAKLFARYTDFDRRLLDRKELIGLLKLAIFASNKPVREVKFGVLDLADTTYVEASPTQLHRAVKEFFEGKQRAGERPGVAKSTAAERKTARKRKHKKEGPVPGLEIATDEGENQALVPETKLDFPVYFTKYRTTGASYLGDTARVYRIRDENGKLHQAYRMTLKRGIIGEYYGVQGMTWKDPPILDGPKDTEERNGRKLELYYDGKRLRLVAWHTKKAVYWVTNTLTRSINNRRLIAIAASLQRIGGK